MKARDAWETFTVIAELAPATVTAFVLLLTAVVAALGWFLLT